MRKIILAALLLATSVPTLPVSAAWRATASTFTVFYCAPAARMARLHDVLRWKAGGYHIIWKVTLETSLDALLVANSSACNSDGRTEAMWTMERVEGEALIVPYLEARGIDTSAMTNAQKADAFSVEFKADLIMWEAEYNAFLAEQATPAPDAVAALEEP